MIALDDLVAWDVETGGEEPGFGLEPFRLAQGRAWLNSCAIAYFDDSRIRSETLRKPTLEQVEDWLTRMVEQRKYIAGWNMPFDVGWLLAMGKASGRSRMRDLVYEARWLDGMLLRRHDYNWPRYRKEGQVSMGLKQAVAEFIPTAAGYEDGIVYDPTTEEEWETLLRYNGRDARYTLHIVALMIRSLLPKDVLRCALIEAASIPLMAEAYVEGIKVNAPHAASMGVKLEETRRLALMNLMLTHPTDIDEKVLASPSKLRALLFDKWGLRPVNYSDVTGDASTDKETLLTLGLTDPRAKQVHAYREAAYLKKKFSDGIVESAAYNGDGQSRPQPRIFGTYTGRVTYSSKTGRGKSERPVGCALHQWKRDPEFRRIIEPPEGHDLVEFDFAGQEFRWMAVLSGDQTMQRLCLPGEDPHAFMGARIAGISYDALRRMLESGDPEAKPKRQLGKVANLSLQFRTSPPTLVSVAAVQFGVDLALDESRAIHATYLSTYRMVPKYWKRQIETARNQGYVRTLGGRRVRLGTPDTWRWKTGDGVEEDWTWGHESTAINAPIQGTGADQKYLGLMVAKALLPQWDARFYMELHDGLFFVVPKAKTESFAERMQAVLSDLPYERAWGFKPSVPMPVDCKIGPSWGELKERH